MRRLVALTMLDIRFQWRHRFYAVYLLICSVYILLLSSLPLAYKETAAVLLTFSDPSALGLLFAGGIVLLEKDQGIHDSLFVTPLQTTEYLLAKAISLSLLSLISAWLIHGLSVGVPESPFLFSLGVLLTSSLFTLLSVGVSVRIRTVNGFILLSQLYALPFALPLLTMADIGPPLVYGLLPTYGSLLLLGGVSRTLTIAEIMYAIAILLLGNTMVWKWAKRSFQRYVRPG